MKFWNFACGRPRLHIGSIWTWRISRNSSAWHRGPRFVTRLTFGEVGYSDQLWSISSECLQIRWKTTWSWAALKGLGSAFRLSYEGTSEALLDMKWTEASVALCVLALAMLTVVPMFLIARIKTRAKQVFFPSISWGDAAGFLAVIWLLSFGVASSAVHVLYHPKTRLPEEPLPSFFLDMGMSFLFLLIPSGILMIINLLIIEFVGKKSGIWIFPMLLVCAVNSLLVGLVLAACDVAQSPSFSHMTWDQIRTALDHDIIHMNLEGTGWGGPFHSISFYTITTWGLWPVALFNLACCKMILSRPRK